MRVTVTTFGGLAAGMRRRAISVDTEGLAPAAATELARLVAEVRAEPGTHPAAAESARDAMTYEVVVDDGSSKTVLKQSDAAATPGFTALLNWLRSNASQP